LSSHYNAGSSYTVTGNVILYAKWEICTFTVSFNTNGATSGAAPAEQTANFNSRINLPSDSGFSKPGFVFGGWDTDSSGTSVSHRADASYTVTDDVTLYAKWFVSVLGTYTFTSDDLYNFYIRYTFNSNGSCTLTGSAYHTADGIYSASVNTITSIVTVSVSLPGYYGYPSSFTVIDSNTIRDNNSNYYTK